MKKFLLTMCLVALLVVVFLFGNLYAMCHCEVSECGNVVELSLFDHVYTHELEEGEV